MVTIDHLKCSHWPQSSQCDYVFVWVIIFLVFVQFVMWNIRVKLSSIKWNYFCSHIIRYAIVSPVRTFQQRPHWMHAWHMLKCIPVTHLKLSRQNQTNSFWHCWQAVNKLWRKVQSRCGWYKSNSFSSAVPRECLDTYILTRLDEEREAVPRTIILSFEIYYIVNDSVIFFYKYVQMHIFMKPNSLWESCIYLKEHFFEF